jgi:uncharacterized repeat protein (TIGR01451 family)
MIVKSQMRALGSNVLIGLAILGGLASRAWGAPPAENILLIYYADTTGQKCADGSTGVGSVGDTYPQQLEAAFATALGPIAASVQTLQIHNTDVGISTELASQYPGKTLANWCQVYDLRFLNDCNNIGWSGQNTADLVTSADMVLYRNYLAQGGSLFLQGEHHDLYARNNNLMQMINSVATSPVVSSICSTYICPDVNTLTPSTINTFTANYGFNNNYNVLGGNMQGWYAGGIPVASYGSGLPLVTISSLSYSGTTGAVLLGWEGGKLKAPYSAGKLVASFETNGFATPALQTATTFQVLQNVYTLLSGCLHYTVTKTFSPSTLCVGDPGTFTICATNTSSFASIPNYSISDTIATCLTYNSSSTSVATSGTGNSSAGAAGTLYWWTFPSIAPGASACVTVNFTASNTTCP